MAERSRAEEANRQLTESLERRVIERTTELTETLEQLEDVSRHKSEFLANMSHELRTPLNAIIGYSEMLQEQAEDADQNELVPDLQRIKASGRHLLELVNEVLDFSKIEAGKVDLYLETFHVPTMLSNVEAIIRPLAEKNYNSLKVHCGDEVGSMQADLTKVQQTLFNLLSNACKFTERGTISVEVTRSREDGVEWVSFKISDTGIGISPEQMGKLFQPFSQADTSTTRKYGGTGLGLVVSRNFCRLMGGDITFESEESKGSIFTCTIPAEVKLAKTETADTDSVTESLRERPALVLVIDDDKGLRGLTSAQLVEAGFSVECAESGAEGLRLAREIHPNAIVLDVFMPGMDGWAVITELKSDPELADIQVIMLTGSEDQELGYALGASDYLIKPVDTVRLASVLSKYRPKEKPYLALIVDDDAENRDIMRRMLEKEGWTVLEAEDGSQGLERLMESRPELVLLDLMMPSMDGFEFIEEVVGHEDWRKIPVVVMTGRDISAADRKRLNGRILKIIEKGSYSREQLVQELRNHVEASLLMIR
jgi:hypothetical protein